MQVDLTPSELFGPTSSNYTLTLYPTQEFYHVYCTRNPQLASIGAVFIIVFTSILFLLYDLSVRREFHAKQELLDAKRKFVRFVSHEVRTPLNSVCMGLTLMKEEIAANTSGDKDVKYTKATDWLTLTEEVTANAHSAVDVLNDFLNYDKVQSGKLSLECTIVPIFSLIERTVTEFKLPAQKNNLHLSINTPLSSDQGKDRDLLKERFVVGDVIRLTQVLRNLVSNAIKFTPNEGKELIICRTQNNRRLDFHLIHDFST
jgi:signal transduction histidine kinase